MEIPGSAPHYGELKKGQEHGHKYPLITFDDKSKYEQELAKHGISLDIKPEEMAI